MYHVEDLGIVEGYDKATALDINDGGTVVGILGEPDSDDCAAFIWKDWTGDGMEVLPAVTDGTGGTEARAINSNASSRIVGRSKQRLVQWSLGGSLQFVETKTSFAHGVSFMDKIVGGYFPSSGGRAAARWNGETGDIIGQIYNPLAPPGSPERWDEALGVNSEVPQVVVGTTRSPTVGVEHAFRWTVGDSFLKDLMLDSTDPSAGRAVNAFGTIAGNVGSQAALWIGDTLRLMENPLSYPISQANDINDHSQVIGEARMFAGPGAPSVAFIDAWAGTALIMVDLNTLIDPATGWSLRSATAINNEGQIVGWGEHDGQHRAFRLTPIKPPDIDIPPYDPPFPPILPPYNPQIPLMDDPFEFLLRRLDVMRRGRRRSGGRA